LDGPALIVHQTEHFVLVQAQGNDLQGRQRNAAGLEEKSGGGELDKAALHERRHDLLKREYSHISTETM